MGCAGKIICVFYKIILYQSLPPAAAAAAKTVLGEWTMFRASVGKVCGQWLQKPHHSQGS